MVINGPKIVRLMAGTIVLLLVLSYIGQLSKYVVGYPTLLGFVDLFYVELENNIPTAYQFLALLSCAIVIAITPHGSYQRHWKWLSIIFLFLAFDEVASLHEMTINPMWRYFGPLSGIWKPLWVIFGLAAVIAVGLAYLGFLFHLKPRERNQVILAAFLFVGGAMGMEMVTALFFDSTDPTFKLNLFYASLAHIEEGMEMFGIVVFLDFLLRRSGDIFVKVENGSSFVTS